LLILNQENRPTIEQVLRHPIVKAELDNILNDFVPLTYEFTTASSAHKVIEQIVEIQCLLATSTDNGLRMINEELIKVANTTETKFLLQAELKAIKQGLQYKVINDNGVKYEGYINQNN
jgi:hypothetical protein